MHFLMFVSQSYRRHRVGLSSQILFSLASVMSPEIAKNNAPSVLPSVLKAFCSKLPGFESENCLSPKPVKNNEGFFAFITK